MIKVGQIREREGLKFVITKIYSTYFGDRAFILYDDGTKIRDITKKEQLEWIKQQKEMER